MEEYQALEHDLAFWLRGVDAHHVVVCSSGTAALHLALEALAVPRSDYGRYAILPDYTMVACARAATMAGFEPVFVDCGYGLLMNPDALEKAAHTHMPCQVVMPVHIYGRRCDMKRLLEVRNRLDGHTWKIVEDMAEVHGCLPNSETDAACWSFYKNKIVAGEEGGAVYFKDKDAADRARELRNLGFDDRHDFFHRPRGHNYRMANCLAEKIRRSLGRFDANLAVRLDLESIYDHYCPRDFKMPPREVPWVYDIRIRGMTASGQRDLVNQLNDAGIPARHGFKPMSFQPEYAGYHAYTSEGHVARTLATEIIYFPIQPGVTTEDSIRQSFRIVGR
jgi:dTDP-4-amino-4,6-dideoxygalactose transaminase